MTEDSDGQGVAKARGRSRWLRTAGGAAGAAAVVAGVWVFGPWSGGGEPGSPGPSGSVDASLAPSSSPTVAARPSPSIAESTTGREAFTVNLWAASEVPWDEVGPGWFLLGFDPERSVPSDEYWDDGWLIGSGETWLLSPDGEAFLGPQPPPGSERIPFWSGSVAWFDIPENSDRCGEATCGEVVSIDARTGVEGHPWKSEYLPGWLQATATASLLDSGGCCSSWDAGLVDAEGVRTNVAGGDLMGGDGGLLTTDGTSYVWPEVIYDADWLPISADVHMKTFDGGEEVVASFDKVVETMGWIDETTVLLDAFRRGDEWEYVEREFIALDVTTGVTSPWSPPVAIYDAVNAPRPGMWLWDLSNSSDSVVTNNDGSVWITLSCEGSCWSSTSGDSLLWIEGTNAQVDGEWVDLTQRLTLVNLLTGEKTVVFDGEPSQGKIVVIQPHAMVYD